MTIISIKVSDAEADVLTKLVVRRGFPDIGAWLEYQLGALKSREKHRSMIAAAQEASMQTLRGKSTVEKGV